MPKKRKESDYSKTVIYKIQCKDPAIKETYGGHSTNLSHRTETHKSDCNNPNGKYYNTYVYQFIRDNGGWDNWEILFQYNFPCANLNEALIEEKNFTEKKKSEKKKKKQKKKKKEKKKNEKEKRANETEEQKKERKEKNRIAGAKYFSNKIKNETEEQREVRLKKEKEKRDEKRKNETEEEEKERLRIKREYGRKKIKCEICNIEIRRDSIPKHIKSKTHLKKLEEYNKNQAIKQLDEELAEQLL